MVAKPHSEQLDAVEAATVEVEFVSTLKVPAPPSHRELGARQTFARAITEEPPTIKQLKRHAEKFGTEAVVQTAVELGYGLDTCVTLQDFCDRLDAAAHRKAHPLSRPMRFPDSEKRVKVLMDLDKKKDEEEESGAAAE